MLDNGVGLEFPLAEQISLLFADVILPELIGAPVEVLRELLNGTEVSAYGAGCVVATLEFLEHQFLQLGHRDLLVTAPYRDSATAAANRQCR